MEIMHDDNNRRTVLVALDHRGAARDFIEHLSVDFNVVAADGADDCLRTMRERADELSAAIIDIEMAEDGGCALLKEIAEDAGLITVPVLIAGMRPLSDEDAVCFDAGAIDYLSWPYQRSLVKKRIENAIMIKRSTTYYEIESMLRELPSNIFLKDAEGRYVFSTHYWHHLDQGDDPNWTIRGKTDLEIRKDRENVAKAMEADREVIETGEEVSYVIEVGDDDGGFVRGGGGGFGGGVCGGGLRSAAVQLPEHEVHPVLRLLATALFQDVVHVGREALQHAHPHVFAVVLYEAVCRDVVEVLGGGHLGGCLSGEVLAGGLHQLDEAVQLVRHEEGVHGIAEQQQVRFPEGLQGGGEVLLQRLDTLPGENILKLQFREPLFQIQAGMQGDGVLALGAAAYNENIHNSTFVA